MKHFLILCFSLITTGLAYSQIQTINVGTSANDHTGDPLRTAFGKVNSNFVYLDGRIDDVVDRIDSLFDAGFNDAVTAARLDSLIDAGVAGAWGTITGTLSAQTDLQAALDAKQSTLTNSAGLASALSDESGTGTVVFSSVTDGKQSTLTNSAGLASALSDESGTGTVVFSSITDAKITNPMTTAGDVIIGGASGTPTRLAAGATSGHVLTSNGSGVAPSWQAASGGSVTQTITNGVTTTSPSEDVLFDALALKANLAGPTFTGTVVLPSTTSIGTVSNTEITYIDGLTSAAQTQIDGKQTTLVSGTNIKTINGSDVIGSGDLTVGAPYLITNTQTTDYTLVLTDGVTDGTSKPKLVIINSASAINLTVPPNSSVAFPVGTVIYSQRSNASGTMNFVAGAGVTLTTTSGGLSDAGQNIIMTLVKTATDTWSVQNGNALTFTSGYASTTTGFSSVSTSVFNYTVIGKLMCFNVVIAGTSNSSAFTFTMPSNYGGQSASFSSIVDDAGAGFDGRLNFANGSNVVTVFKTPGAGGFTASGTKAVRLAGMCIQIQ
jgi:hypothetical protein